MTSVISSGAIELLNEPVLFIERRADAINLLVGWNQARKMRIFRSDGTPIAYFYEEIPESSTISSRREDRDFKILMYNNQNEHILTIRRQIQTVSTLVQCYSTHNLLIGEIRQRFHLWRRKYTILHKNCINETANDKRRCLADSCPHMSEFGSIVVKPFSMSLEVTKKSRSNDKICLITRCWQELGHKFGSIPGCYAVDFEPRGSDNVLGISHRAILVGAAASIDNDIFSRDAACKHKPNVVYQYGSPL